MLIVGCGYTGTAFGRALAADGWKVVGTTRSAEGAADLRAAGIEPRLWPGEPLAPEIARASHMLVSVPPDAEGDPLLRAHGEAIAAAAPGLRWVGYLSTTAVYGDHGGAWVDESTPPRPSTERGRRRLAAERAWLDLAARAGLAVHIFRLAGIYGPGRGPFAKLRAGRARRIVKPGQVFGRVHVDDIVAVLRASMAAPRPGAIYNVTDDLPAPPEDVLAFAAELLGLPVPPAEPFESAAMTPMARSFYAENKRVSNRRIREELGVRLRYPTYREGLRALAREDGAG
ncbi:MAG: SDR family oxidoreductase [Alphaproteobacteria bacterium]|nr:MAG: SDR family oxidoreductase [Alphaproteobacteria bacterium]